MNQKREEAPASSSSPPPPQPPKESLAQRYKVVWRLLLISNLALGAYMFARARKKEKDVEDSKGAAKIPTAPIETATPLAEEPTLSPPIIEPEKVRQPIPDDQQHELFKWMLEEKRKAKPNNPEERKRIDEEKAILKQFIRAKSIPRI
ncbi:glycine hydroxymethyltransferase [Sarracenia purpurea var. burkii]